MPTLFEAENEFPPETIMGPDIENDDADEYEDPDDEDEDLDDEDLNDEYDDAYGVISLLIYYRDQGF